MTGILPGFTFDGRVVIVTGAASGIGVGIAEMLAEAGATVVIADRDSAGAADVAARIGGDSIALDLADEASIVHACARIVEHHGTPWALVNNAGLQDRESFLDGTAAQWDRMASVNARGAYLMTREVGRAMVAAGNGGRIVNIASAALSGSIIKGLVAYTGSKGALLGLGTAAAFELAEHRITVNTVLPGGVVTPGSMGAGSGTVAAEGPGRRPLPLGMAEPRDIGAAVLFLASPAARAITNQMIAVDGGHSVT